MIKVLTNWIARFMPETSSGRIADHVGLMSAYRCETGVKKSGVGAFQVLIGKEPDAKGTSTAYEAVGLINL